MAINNASFGHTGINPPIFKKKKKKNPTIDKRQLNVFSKDRSSGLLSAAGGN